jgi:sterol desaturase/sphingolipid hydroxylase (fatty acid hydroxylase superfamily)
MLSTYLQILLQSAAIPIVALFLLERCFPAERGQRLSGYFFNLFYFLGALWIILHLSPPLMRVQELIRSWTGVLHVPPIESPVARVAASFGVVLVWDFFYYWAHRAMHQIPWLWEIHKLHHSDRAMSSITAQRIHLASYVLGAFVVTLPIQILFDGFVLPVVVATVFFNGLAYFNHANLRLSLGPLTPIIMGPQLHRLHHSRLPQHLDCNFAGFFPVLDILFRTYCKPQKDEFPPTGLPSGESMNDLASITIAEVVSWARRLRP